VTLSQAQLAACRRHELDVHLFDARQLKRESFGAFDAVASLGRSTLLLARRVPRPGARRRSTAISFAASRTSSAKGALLPANDGFWPEHDPLDDVDIHGRATPTRGT